MNYSDPPSRYSDDDRCEWRTTKGERCKRAWVVRRSETDPTPVCLQHSVLELRRSA